MSAGWAGCDQYGSAAPAVEAVSGAASSTSAVAEAPSGSAEEDNRLQSHQTK